MYNHLLVPIAFHGQADDGTPALTVAIALSNPGARVTFLHVMDEMPGPTITYIPDTFRRELRAGLLAELGARAAVLPNAHAVLADGKPAPVILDWAGANGVDCIVITSHQPGLQDWFLGSTAARVVRHAHCAVHVLR